MTRRLSTILTMAVAACTAGVPVAAGPLEADRLPKDAKWVIHVDYESLSDSALAERVRRKRPELVERVQNWFEENCGTNPRKDIDSITLFGSDYEPHSGAAVVFGDFDQSKVESLLKQKRDVKITEDDGHRFYTWSLPRGHRGFQGEHLSATGASARESEGRVTHNPTDQSAGTTANESSQSEAQSSPTPEATTSPNRSEQGIDKQREITATLIDGKTAILTGSVDRAKKTLRLLNGEEPVLKSDSSLLTDMPEDALIYGAAIDLKNIREHSRPFPILAQHKRVQYAFGERNDEMFETLVFVADRSSTAREMETAMQGLIAFAKLWAGDLQTLRDLYDDAEIDRDGSTVTVEWQGSVEDVMTALDELQPRFQAWKEYHQKMRR